MSCTAPAAGANAVAATLWPATDIFCKGIGEAMLTNKLLMSGRPGRSCKRSRRGPAAFFAIAKQPANIVQKRWRCPERAYGFEYGGHACAIIAGTGRLRLRVVVRHYQQARPPGC